MIPRAIRESSWQPSGSDSVDAIAFSRDQRILVAPPAAPLGGHQHPVGPRPPGPAAAAIGVRGRGVPLRSRRTADRGHEPVRRPAVALWNVARPRRPPARRLAAAPLCPRTRARCRRRKPGRLVFSPDGQILASVSGRDQVTMWNLTRPDRAIRIATLAGPATTSRRSRSPPGNLLAGVTYHGSVLVFRVACPLARSSSTTRPGLLAGARFPGGGRAPAIPCGSGRRRLRGGLHRRTGTP